MKKLLLLVPVLGIVLLASSCSNDAANSTEANQVDKQQQVYVNNQPAPAFDWSLERHILTELYKARNNAVQTYSYVRNLNGQVVFSCKSIGFPIPSNTQLTNPEKADNFGSYGAYTSPQAEPNGLYTSPSTAGTFVFCVNSDGTVSPSYFEANVETHLSTLNGSDNGLSSDGDLKIDLKK
jgi:hypothetical protein